MRRLILLIVVAATLVGLATAGAHGRASFTKGALTCCSTISIAAWLLVTIGIPNFFCRRSIVSMPRQLVHERNKQSGSMPESCDSKTVKSLPA